MLKVKMGVGIGIVNIGSNAYPSSMKIALITRPNAATWGGDLKALRAIQLGCERLGHTVVLLPPFDEEITTCNFAFITNTCLDQRDNWKWLKERKIPYGCICFHEDFKKYLGYCRGMHNYVIGALKLPDASLHKMIGHLRNDPEMIKWYTRANWDTSINYEVLKGAKICIANSEIEAATIRRDCPEANIKVVYWTAGMADEWNDEISEDFLTITGLSHKEYILQVGRLEPRKNQLSTLLACQEEKRPLVFIATQGHFDDYEEAFIQLASRIRKNRTFLITDKRPSSRQGSLEIVQMPNGRKLTSESLKSAYQHARAHVHPAFYELPGYTYFESVRYGIPTLASSWTSISEYFGNEKAGATLNGLVAYTLPYQITDIENKLKKLLDIQAPYPSLSLFKRLPTDVAREILTALN